MSIRNMEERILTVSSVCQISRELSQLLLQYHGWSCDSAISGYFDGELDKIQKNQKDSVEVIPLVDTIESIEDSELSVETIGWPKGLPSFQVTCLSTINSKYSYSVGTTLLLEPDGRHYSYHRKAQVLTKGNNDEFPAYCRVYQQEGASQNQRYYIGRINEKIGNDLAILLDLNIITATCSVAYCPSPIRSFSTLILIVEVFVKELAFTNLFQYFKQHPIPSSSILHQAYPNASLSTLVDIINESIYYLLYFSVYCTKGQQESHQLQYSNTIAKSIQTSFSSFTIPETKQPESKPIEIIENSNSTGIISSIHKRLNQPQKEIIEITDSLSEGEVLENTDSMPLVSNELYNASLPSIQFSEGLKDIILREYQLQALFWMMQREQGKHAESSSSEQPEDNSMWEAHSFLDHSLYYFCPMFRSVTLENPSNLYHMKGGIIADEMGLGKTITMLSLLLMNRGKPDSTIELKKEQSTMEIVENESVSACIPRTKILHEGGSLIICPLSLLYMWQNEILTHIEPGILSCCIYHSNQFYEISHQSKPVKILNPLHYHIVLTTYDTCFAAFSRYKNNTENWLYSTQWKRIIIDEGHVIKNDKTVLHKAIVSLRGEIHWIISGTPLQNTVNDLFSLFRFLRYEPWCYRNVWNNIINSGNETPKHSHENETPKHSHEIHINMNIDIKTDLNRLRYPLSLIMLRRTYQSKDSKGQLIVKLPEKEIKIVYLDFTQEENTFYQQVLQRSRTMFNNFVLQGIVKRQYAMILSLLLSLRQCCDHPFLLLSRANGLLKKQDDEEIEKALTSQFIQQIYSQSFESRENVTSYAHSVLKEIQQKGSLCSLLCPICCEPIRFHPVFTSCLHYFCEDCINTLAKQTGYPIACPQCRQLNKRQDLLMCDYHLYEYKNIAFDAESMWYTSTKIDMILSIVDSIFHAFDENVEKAQQEYGNILIFSQWTEMLHDIGIALKKNQIDFLKFDGSLSKQEREKVLNAFESNNHNEYMEFEQEVNDSEMIAEEEESEKESTPTSFFDVKSKTIDNSFKKTTSRASLKRNATSTDSSTVKRIAKKDENENENENANTNKKEESPKSPKKQSSKYPKILLISLRAGGVGLNLTSANTVIMCDPWWNEAVEKQAINRAFRIGQKRKVMVYRLIIKNSIEEKILKLQEKKEQLIQNTLDFQNATSIKLTIDEIKDLLQ